MHWTHFAVALESGIAEGLPCKCCGQSVSDILYYPADATPEQSDAIHEIWGVDDWDLLVCEECMGGHCGAVPGLNADNWLSERVEQHKAKLA